MADELASTIGPVSADEQPNERPRLEIDSGYNQLVLRIRNYLFPVTCHLSCHVMIFSQKGNAFAYIDMNPTTPSMRKKNNKECVKGVMRGLR